MIGYPKDFKDLLANEQWKDHYIGLGNPNAKILIVGKECAINTKSNKEEDIMLNNITYLQNYQQWKNNADNNILEVNKWNPHDIYYDYNLYNPLHPFYGQLYKPLRTKKDGTKNGGTSSTWYNYQKLINYYRIRKGIPIDDSCVDFFRDCFITELNELCRPNNNNLTSTECYDTEMSVRSRFELICITPYFQSQFDTVILACGNYIDKLLDKTKLMFGNATIICDAPEFGQQNRLRQLSFNVEDGLLRNIADRII